MLRAAKQYSDEMQQPTKCDGIARTWNDLMISDPAAQNPLRSSRGRGFKSPSRRRSEPVFIDETGFDLVQQQRTAAHRSSRSPNHRRASLVAAGDAWL